jgi:hypothetical protein
MRECSRPCPRATPLCLEPMSTGRPGSPSKPRLARACVERPDATGDGRDHGRIAPGRSLKKSGAAADAACRTLCGRPSGARPATPRHWKWKRRIAIAFGLVLLAQGWITHPQLQTALEAQRNSGHGRIGDWLAQSCGLDEERITRGLGMQWSCPILAREGFSPAAMALVMPRRFVTEFGLLPLRVAGSSLLYMAFENRMDAAAALAVEQMSGLKVESGLLGATEFAEVRAGLLAAKSVPVETSLQRDADALTTSIVKILENRQPIASRMVRVHGLYWLRLWLESGAIGRSGTLPESTEDVEDYLFLIDSRRTPRPPVA